MADSLLVVGELSSFLGEDIPAADEQFLLEMATAAVQDAAGQRLVRVTDDEISLLGTAEHWLELPERPIESVASVEINSTPVTDFLLRGYRLWRDQGWQVSESLLIWGGAEPPSVVDVVYTHGYESGDQALEFARSATLTLAAQLYANPIGGTGFSIDDYREQFSQATAAGAVGEVPTALRQALRRRYDRRTRMLTAI